MSHTTFWLKTLLLIGCAVAIHLFSTNPFWVERYYSTGIYPFISITLKLGFGWLPFSIGDILYGILIIWIGKGIFGLIQSIAKKKINRKSIIESCKKITTMLLLIYIIFNVLWGINYNRKGITTQLGIPLQKYSVTELIEIDSMLVQKVNYSKKFSNKKSIDLANTSEIFTQAANAYETIQHRYPFLEYGPASVKISLWGWLGNYLGFLGYYNPFTGEAQVNNTVPKFLQPFTTCHEMAHQIGYAKENEANFVAYLAGTAATDSFFHYSIYLDLFLYTNNNLFAVDSLAAKNFSTQLVPEVKADLKQWRQFNLSHKNPVEPVVRWMYGQYLQHNQQPSGVLSYDEVTGFIIGYYKKYGKI